MTALHPPAAVAAAANVNVDLPVGRPPGDLHLVLGLDLDELDASPAVLAGLGQPRLLEGDRVIVRPWTSLIAT